MLNLEAIPYCGAPPVPGSTTWNLDPVLIAVLSLIAVGYAVMARTDGTAKWQRYCFFSGWAILSLALISPLCNLSVALFSARVGQHMLLTFVAAPLIATGLPVVFVCHARGFLGFLYWPGMWNGLFVAVTYAVMLWLWHVPGPYELTFHNSLVYWTMHATLVGAAVLLWRALLDHSEPGAALLASIFTGLQMTLLGAILTFANRPLFQTHLKTSNAWGFSPLEDQQLGGLIMWIPTGTILLAFVLWACATLIAAPRPDSISQR